MTGPLSDIQLSAVDTSSAELCGRFVLTHSESKRFLESLSMWVIQAMDEIGSDDLQRLISSVALMFVESTSLISDIISERGAANQGGDDLPPVFPHQLINIDMCSLSCVINTHHSRLKRRFSSTDINHIADNLVQFKCAYI